MNVVGSVVQTKLGQETVGVLSSEKHNKYVKFNVQDYGPVTLRLLDQMEKFGIEVKLTS